MNVNRYNDVLKTGVNNAILLCRFLRDFHHEEAIFIFYSFPSATRNLLFIFKLLTFESHKSYLSAAEICNILNIHYATSVNNAPEIGLLESISFSDVRLKLFGQKN